MTVDISPVGLSWDKPLGNQGGVETFILQHNGHKVIISGIQPSDTKNAIAIHVHYTMYCVECGEEEGRRHEANPVVDVPDGE